MEYVDTAVIKECQHGRIERFTKVYDAYIKKIYNFIYHKTMHRETAEDLTSTVFMKALENIQSFDESKGSFNAWLYRIARNTVIDHYRTSKDVMDIADAWGLSSKEDILRSVESNEQLERVRGYLETLKPQHREIIIMRVWDQLSYKEIADITGLTEANCKMTFSRAIRRLRDELGMGLLSIFALIATTVWQHH